MPKTRIPHIKAALSDIKSGIATTEWFTFFSYLFNLTSNGNITRVLTASATLDFPNTASGAASELTISVPGAKDGDPVHIGVEAASVPAGDDKYFAWVSAADTVTVRFCNDSGGPVDPASGTFKVVVTQF